ncbi:Uncharacterised protein [uncultured archaeon]|nr:Uncharacterised protein [uncultured archaeon]
MFDDRELMIMIPELKDMGRRCGPCVKENPIRLDSGAWQRKLKMSSRIVAYKRSTHSDSLRAQKEVMDLLLDAERPISHMTLLAVLAMRNGMERDTLMGYLNAIASLERSGVITPKSGRWLMPMARDSLPAVIESVLKGANESVTANDIAMSVYGRTGKRICDDINYACNLLETLDIAVKLPSDSAMGHNNYRFIHTRMRYSLKTIPLWNIKYVVFSAIDRHGPISKSGLMRDPAVGRLISVHGTSLSKGLVSSKVDNSIDGLRSQRLIAAEILNGQRATQCFATTNVGHGLLRSAIEMGYLSEELRRRLLGYANHGMIPSQQDRAERIIRWLKVLIEMDKENGKAHVIAKRLCENEGYVRGIVNGGASPCRKLSDEKIEEECMPLVMSYSEEYGKRLQKYLKERGSGRGPNNQRLV